MKTKSKSPILTDTVKRFLFWNITIFIIILLTFNFFILFITDFVLNKNLDHRIQHEMENILKTLEIRNDSLVLLSNKELEEKDFKEVKETSFFLQIYYVNGNVFIKSENVQKFQTIPIERSVFRNDYSFYNLAAGSDKLRSGYYRFENSAGKIIAFLQLSIFKTEAGLILHDVFIFNLLSLPILLLLIFFASIFLVKKTLSPVKNIIETAVKISAQNLNERISYKADSSDEIGRLRDTLNDLFERLEFQVNQISQFTDHASHQLMNPLTITKTELDFALRKQRNPEEYKNSLELIKDQTEKMIKIINLLLIISKHQEEQKTKKSLFNLSKLIADEITKTFNTKALSFQIEPNIYLRGNSEIFSIVIENLIDNAIKYSSASPDVQILLRKNKGNVEFTVSDKGMGINDGDKEKIFEKFFRTAKAEEFGIKGYGLGLSVVKSIVTQMNGSISVEDNIPQGSTFIIRLPEIRVD